MFIEEKNKLLLTKNKIKFVINHKKKKKEDNFKNLVFFFFFFFFFMIDNKFNFIFY